MTEIEQPQNDKRPIILALDTSSRFTSLAIQRGEEVTASFGALLDENRSSRLWRLIDFLVVETGLKVEEVDLFAVCTGPGGFTGLRVGITAAKGFAGALGKPVVGITSLEAAAAAIRDRSDTVERVLVLHHASKGEVYSQIFCMNESGIPISASEPSVGRLEPVLEAIREDRALMITGDAAAACEQQIEEFRRPVGGSGSTSEPVWVLRKSPQFFAPTIAHLAYFRYKAKMTMEPAALQACYVRGADIKIKQQV